MISQFLLVDFSTVSFRYHLSSFCTFAVNIITLVCGNLVADYPFYHVILNFNSLSNNKITGWSKFKAFADDKINVTEKKKEICFGLVENIMGKGENAGNQQFLLFTLCFQKALSSGSLKVRTI